MGVTLQEWNTFTPDQLLQRYDETELKSFALSLKSPAAPVSEDGGFGDRGGFFDIAPVNQEADFLSGDNLGRLAGNLPGSAVNVAKDTFNAITSPIDTLSGLVEAGPSGILSALGERFGSLDALKKTAVEDPTGLLLDVAPVGQAIGAGAKAGRLGSTAARVANAAPNLNPATALVSGAQGIASKAGSVAGGGAALTASLLTGVERPTLTAARRAVTGTNAQNQAFRVSRRGLDDSDIIPQGIDATVKKLGEDRSRVFTQAQNELQGQNIRATDAQLQAFHSKMQADLDADFEIGTKDVKVTQPEQQFSNILDEQGNQIPIGDPPGEAVRKKALDLGEVGGLRESPKAIQGKLNRAFSKIIESRGELNELWKARQDVDRIAIASVAGNASKIEGAIFTQMRNNITDLLSELGGKRFRDLNKQYAQSSELIKDFQDVTAAGGTKKGQIKAVQGAVGDAQRFDTEILARAEAQGGAPLSASAAGSQLGSTAAKGLIGKNKLAAAVFAGPALLFQNPLLLAPIFLTNPKTIGRIIELTGLAENKARKVMDGVNQIMALPGATQMAEQGLTLGAIIQQLSPDEEEEERPSNILGALGASQR